MAILDNFYEYFPCAMTPLVTKLLAQYLENHKIPNSMTIISKCLSNLHVWKKSKRSWCSKM